MGHTDQSSKRKKMFIKINASEVLFNTISPNPTRQAGEKKVTN